MENFILFLVVTAAVIVGNLLVNLALPALMKHLNPPQLPPKQYDLSETFNILNKLVELEFISVIEVPYYVKGINVIGDFRKVQTEIVNNVMNALSSKFLMSCNSAGIKLDYVITFVTRTTNAKLIDYMKIHNFTLKK